MITAGVGPAVVALVVLSPGAAGAGAAGSAPVRDCGFVFLSSFVFLFLVCIYVYNQFL